MGIRWVKDPYLSKIREIAPAEINCQAVNHLP